MDIGVPVEHLSHRSHGVCGLQRQNLFENQRRRALDDTQVLHT